MKYINKYVDLAAYTADTNRPTEAKTVSKVAQSLRYEGKNIVVDKKYCALGDTVVFDKNDSTIKVVKLDTLNIATLGSNYLIGGTVFWRTEKKAYILSNQYASSGSQWGAPYRVKITGFDFATGGSFAITVNSTATGAIVYTASDTLATIATSMMAALQAAGFTAATGWSCTAYTAYNCIVVQQNWYTPNVTSFTVADNDNKVIRTILTGNYQTALSGILTAAYYFKNGGRLTGQAIGNYFGGLEYYSVNGSDSIGIPASSETIVKQSRFNATDNPLLVSTFSTYQNYIFAHLLKFPCSKGIVVYTDGKQNTDLLSAVTFIDYDGSVKQAYPAAYFAKTYGITAAGYTTGLEPGNWWNPSIAEIHLFLKDITYGLSGIQIGTSDMVNRGIYAGGGVPISVNTSLHWSSSEGNLNSGCSYQRTYSIPAKMSSGLVRPITIIQL